MKWVYQSLAIVCLCAGCRPPEPDSGANISSHIESVVPDDRDQQVLEAVLRELVKKGLSKWTFGKTPKTEIVLISTTPGYSGLLLLNSQIRLELRGRDEMLPVNVESAMLRRNLASSATSDKPKAVFASYTNLTFGEGVIMGDWPDGVTISAFEIAYPNAGGWIAACLPGYSEDGSLAFVRAGVGPFAHAATLSAILEKTEQGWMVKWHSICPYL